MIKTKLSQGIKSKILPVSLFQEKKAQMKIQQMAFMIIAVMVFFGLVGLVIIAVVFSGYKDKATDLAQENAMLLVSKISNSPEFSCGYAFGESKGSCIDSDKAIVLKDNIEKYKKFWGVSSIKIRKIYPKKDGKDVECELGTTYPDCNLIEVLSGTGIATQNFVSLCRKEFDGSRTYNKCELAKILISYEEVE